MRRRKGVLTKEECVELSTSVYSCYHVHDILCEHQMMSSIMVKAINSCYLVSAIEPIGVLDCISFRSRSQVQIWTYIHIHFQPLCKCK